MVILGIEAAAGVAGAAVVRDEKLLAEIIYNNKKTHSQTLLPAIEKVLSESGYDRRLKGLRCGEESTEASFSLRRMPR